MSPRRRQVHPIARAANRLDGRAKASPHAPEAAQRREGVIFRWESFGRQAIEPAAAPDAPNVDLSTCVPLEFDTLNYGEQDWPEDPLGPADARPETESCYGEASLRRAAAQAEPLDPDRVDLPAKPPVEALPLLPPDVAALVKSPRLVPLKGVVGAASVVRVYPGQYLPFLRRLFDARLINVHYREELSIFPRYVENDLFAIPKSKDKAGVGPQRFIMYARPGNSHLLPPENPDLPDRQVWEELILDPLENWTFGGTDLTYFFSSLVVMRWLEGLQGLPGVDVSPANPLGGKTGQVWITLRVASRGGKWSIFLAQHGHRHMWRRARERGAHYGVGVTEEIGLRGNRRAVRIQPGVVALSVYSDHGGQLGLSRDVRHVQAQFIYQVREADLGLSYVKWILATRLEALRLGWEISLLTGVVRPPPAQLQALIADTRAVLRTGRRTSHEMRSIVGRWTAVLLLRRPLIAAFHYVFDAQDGPLRPREAEEFRMVVDLAPCIQRNLYKAFDDVLVCFDASLSGGAVVYAFVSASTAESYSTLNVRNMYDKDDVPCAERQQKLLWERGFGELSWTTAFTKDFRAVDQKINTLEGDMACASLEWLSRIARFNAKRLVLLGDNLAVLCALSKGRSSSLGLRGCCRRAAAYEVSLYCHAYWTWVPTDHNPADAASRIYDVRPRGPPATQGRLRSRGRILARPR